MTGKVDNNAPVLREYVARAVELPNGGFLAEYGFPGGTVRFINAGDEPFVYHKVEDAENEARRVLVESLNSRSHTRFGSKREISKKMSGDVFAAELAEVGIPLSEFAMMWGTKRDTVLSWIQGEKDVPFPLRWVLRLLRLPAALDLAQKTVAENVTYKPEWVEHQRKTLPKG